jgi:hypothetical protein
VVTAAYYDDCPAVGTAAEAGTSQKGLQGILRFTGADASQEKSVSPAPGRVFLGTACQLGTAISEGCVQYTPKTTTIAKIRDEVLRTLESRTLTTTTANTLRGQMGWAASNAYGRVGRTASWHLREWTKTAGKGMDIELLLRELGTLLEVFEHLPVRPVQVLGAPTPPVIVYTDASWGDTKVNRVGWLVFYPESDLARGFSMVISGELVATFSPRITQIVPAEA